MIPALATIELPLVTVSEANRASHEPWRARQKRAKAQGNTVCALMLAHRASWQHVRLPLVVVLTRYSTGTLDDGNLGASLKYVQDAVCDSLGMYLPKGEGPRPHNVRAPGFAVPRTQHYDDRDRLSWLYTQSKCARGRERVEVRFYEPGCVARWLLSRLTETGPSEIERWITANAAALDATLATTLAREPGR